MSRREGGIETRRQRGSSIMTTAACLHKKKERGADRGNDNEEGCAESHWLATKCMH